MSFKEFTKNEEGFGSISKTVLISLVVSFIVFGVLYFSRLKYVSNFMPKYGFFIFFSILSYALIMPSLKRVRTYKEFPCMSGMMIGMTIGMISGFLPGFFIGATNGMFWGSVWGMFVGIGFGVMTGKCCGVMGVMEGMMAGFMGGLMGAMTSIMMFNDNLKAAGVIVFIIGSFIMMGLEFMIYKETRALDRRADAGELFNIVLSFLLTLFTIWLSVFGPRSVLFQ